MTAWTSEELTSIGTAEELQMWRIGPRKPAREE
jgi:hypothetical protein